MHLAMSSTPEKIKRLNKLFESHYRVFSQSIEENISIQATDKMLLNLASLKKKKKKDKNIFFKRKGTHNYIPL